MTDDFPELEASITIKAAPAQVWAAVSDVRRMASYSHQVVKTVVLGGPVKLGTRYLNINHQGWKHWPTTAKVVRFDPHSEFAFKVVENGTLWTYRLEPTAEGGTTLTQRRTAKDVTILPKVLIPAALGGLPSFNDEMQAGMQQTLERLKADIES